MSFEEDDRLRMLVLVAMVGCTSGSGDSGSPRPLIQDPSDVADTRPTGVDTGVGEFTIWVPDREGRTIVAMIGDYGVNTSNEANAAAVVEMLEPDFIITFGDNNYPSGAAETMDDNVGKYYSNWISPYIGDYGDGAAENKFFPCMGNHDWYSENGQAYLDYFTLPHNERYYSFTQDNLELFCIDADSHEPDSPYANGTQGLWARAGLMASTATWKVVYMHHPPYSSGTHGNNNWMQWPFESWGADTVWGGHDHNYERISQDGVLYGISGIAGTGLRTMGVPVANSNVAFRDQHGITIGSFGEEDARFLSYSVYGLLIDDVVIRKDFALGGSQPILDKGSAWKYWDKRIYPGATWTDLGYDDSAWLVGGAQLGYGQGDEFTQISGGTDPFDKNITAWFRQEFTVADPGLYDGLKFGLLVHDGAVVYLNGDEVYRYNMPAGVVGSGTLALAEANFLEQNTWSIFETANTLNVGTNIVSVEVHLYAPTAFDTGFDLTLAGRTDDRLVPMGSTWKFKASANGPIGDWWGGDYADQSWDSGDAPLGFGIEGINTVIPSGNDDLNKFPTTWYRKTFTVADKASIEAVILETVRSDAAIVYLNGTEIWRINLPQTPVAATDYAGTPVPTGWKELPASTFIDTDLLVEGTNTIAVEVHNAAADTVDHIFDLALIPLP